MKQSIHIIWIVFFISILISGNKAFAKTAENSDFLIVDGVLSKYIGEVNVNKTLEIPEGVKSIGEKAFNTEAWDVSKEGCLTLCIPRNVKICAGAFISCVPMNITFEEGRLEIEDGAFQYAGYFNEGKMTVTLPSSIKIIGERAFYNGFLGEPIKLNLNKGLVVVEDYALSGTKITMFRKV